MEQTIETLAPGFSGFYNSIWEFDDDAINVDIAEQREERGLDELSDYTLDIDYKRYRVDVAKQYCKVTSKLLDDYIESMTFKELESPREYNFTTDKIVCDVTIDTDKISAWCEDNKDELSEYITQRFTSRDGFCSFFSNDINEWIDATNNFTNFDMEDGWCTLIQYLR